MSERKGEKDAESRGIMHFVDCSRYKLQGIALLRSLLVGGNTDEKYGKTSHPNPLKILDEGTIMDLVEGKPIPQERGQEGRGTFLHIFLVLV